MEMITEEQLEKLVWKEPIWQTDPRCSKPGCGYPDGKPCIGCGRTMTLELFIAEASRFRSQRDALDKRLKAVTELARQGLRLQQSPDYLEGLNKIMGLQRELELMKVGARVNENGLTSQINTLQQSLEAANRELKAATLKANSSLANNLCPDHRDKQQGKPCLACSLEVAKRAFVLWNLRPPPEDHKRKEQGTNE